jgi:hypothetical protein
MRALTLTLSLLVVVLLPPFASGEPGTESIGRPNDLSVMNQPGAPEARLEECLATSPQPSPCISAYRDAILREIFTSAKEHPEYPKSFVARENGTTKHPIDNLGLLKALREAQPGEWRKVYKDGFMSGQKVSLHYFEHASGKIFGLKVKAGWSN